MTLEVPDALVAVVALKIVASDVLLWSALRELQRLRDWRHDVESDYLGAIQERLAEHDVALFGFFRPLVWKKSKASRAKRRVDSGGNEQDSGKY